LPEPRRLLVLVLAPLAFAAAGCGDDIAHYRVPKEAPASPGAPSQGGAVMASTSPAPAPGGGGLAWTLPRGWTESRGGGGMRYATLVAPIQGKVDVSVTVLAGDAGGELANVNRWRNQIGLPPLDGAALERARKPVGAKLGPVALYDFTSEAAPRRRVVAGYTQVEGNTWFVKMSGDEGPVGEARKDFVRIVESLRLE